MFSWTSVPLVPQIAQGQYREKWEELRHMELILETHRWPSSTWSAIWASWDTLHTTTAAPAGGVHLKPGQALTHVFSATSNDSNKLLWANVLSFQCYLQIDWHLRLYLLNIISFILLFYFNPWLIKLFNINLIIKDVINLQWGFRTRKLRVLLCWPWAFLSV